MDRDFEDIIHAQRLAFNAHCVGLEDVAGLVVGQPAALDVIRVVGEVDLCAVIDAAFETHRFLLTQYLQQRHDTPGSRLAPGQCGIRRDVPGLARKKGTLDFSRGAVVAGRALRDAVFCGECRDRNILQPDIVSASETTEFRSKYSGFLPISANYNEG